MIKFFSKKNKYITVTRTSSSVVEDSQKPNIPSGRWIKCDGCGRILYKDDVEENYMICNFCKHHIRLTSKERIDLILDKNSFIEYDENITSGNPLDFKGYEIKIQKYREESGINEAVITGEGTINGLSAVVAVMDSKFMMGSMGSVVGEKITRAIEKATSMKRPIIIFTSSGGARMLEGIMSLMQMAKTSSALKRFSDNGGLFISVITDPTTGGVTASFAMLGDIIIGEEGALIGFAGKRVIEQTIKQKLPDEFQTVEFLLEHGFIDKIAARSELKALLGNILSLHQEVD